MIQISYPLTRHSPLYKNSPPVTIERTKSIDAGDSSNSSHVSFSNHSGTHIDVPLHFCKNAESVTDILKAENRFYPVYCLDIPRTGLSPLTPEDFSGRLSGISDAEVLLVRTGMCRLRDTGTYSSDYPWVDPELPDFLRQNLPRLRIFGTDALSVSNPAFREEGRECHRNFLCKKPPIMILEDLCLPDEMICSRQWGLRLYPWILDKTDGVPVVALLEEKALERQEQ